MKRATNKTATTNKTTTKNTKALGRPKAEAGTTRKGVVIYFSAEEREIVEQGMELEGFEEFAVFTRRAALDRAKANIARAKATIASQRAGTIP